MVGLLAFIIGFGIGGAILAGGKGYEWKTDRDIRLKEKEHWDNFDRNMLVEKGVVFEPDPQRPGQTIITKPDLAKVNDLGSQLAQTQGLLGRVQEAQTRFSGTVDEFAYRLDQVLGSDFSASLMYGIAYESKLTITPKIGRYIFTKVFGAKSEELKRLNESYEVYSDRNNLTLYEMPRFLKNLKKSADSDTSTTQTQRNAWSNIVDKIPDLINYGTKLSELNNIAPSLSHEWKIQYINNSLSKIRSNAKINLTSTNFSPESLNDELEKLNLSSTEYQRFIEGARESRVFDRNINSAIGKFLDGSNTNKLTQDEKIISAFKEGTAGGDNPNYRLNIAKEEDIPKITSLLSPEGKKKFLEKLTEAKASPAQSDSQPIDMHDAAVAMSITELTPVIKEFLTSGDEGALRKNLEGKIKNTKALEKTFNEIKSMRPTPAPTVQTPKKPFPSVKTPATSSPREFVPQDF